MQYSSREEVPLATEPKATPRFGSISSPLSYRPSYSGGTYRSAGIKRDVAPTTTPAPSYTSKYSSLASAKEDKEKDLLKKTAANKTATTTKYGSSKDISTPEPKATTSNTRYSSSSSLAASRLKAKDPAPRPAISVSRVKSRDPSPIAKKTYGNRSRDPSPSEPVKERFSSTTNSYMSTLSRFYPRTGTSSSSYTNSYGGNSSSVSSRGNSSALSYMNANESAIRSTRRRLAKEESSKSSSTSSPSASFAKTKPREKELSPKKVDSKAASPCAEQPIVATEPVPMVDVSVVTRGTSPTMSTTTNITRTRRLEQAKTVEKIIQRPAKRPPMSDKIIQSDRLDDSTKHCRFLATNNSPSPSWTNYMETKFSSRLNKSSGTSSASNSHSQSDSRGKSERTSSESSREKTTSPSKSRESSVSKSPARTNSVSNGRSDKSKTKSPTKQKTNGTRALPPPVPKESPTKTIPTSNSSASNSSNGSKWANKDFRKSALNVGPTDRPRKTRASSVGSEDSCGRDSNRSQKSASPCLRTDRSSSVSSEISSSSTTTTGNADDFAKTFGKLLISPSPVAQLPSSHVDTMHSQKITNNSSCDSYSPILGLAMKKQLEASSVSVNGSAINSDASHNIESIANLFNVNLDDINDDECEMQRRTNDNNSTVANLIFDNDNDNDHHNENGHSNDNTQYFIDSQFDAPDLSTKTTSSSTNPRLNDTDNTSWWLNSIPYDEAAADQPTLVFNGVNMKNKLRHIDSGELPWWMTENDDVTIADDITLNQSETEPDLSLAEDSHKFGGEWLANANGAGAAGGDENLWQVHDDNGMLLSPSIEAKLAEPTRPLYKISHIKSGERAWWMDDNNNTVSSDAKDEPTYLENVQTANSLAPPSLAIETDERSSWLSSDESRWKYPIKYVNMQDDIEQPWWMKSDEPEVAPPTKEFRDCAKLQYNSNTNSLEYDPMPLGDRASPEGLEDLNSKHRLSASYSFLAANELTAPKNDKKSYISRFENVDDLLGGSCHTLNPMLLDRFSGDVFEEITPAQVRIHDSTPQFIHRMADET